MTLGLNLVDPRELNACEADAADMAAIAASQGFGVSTLMTKAATRSRVKKEIRPPAPSRPATSLC